MLLAISQFLIPKKFANFFEIRTYFLIFRNNPSVCFRPEADTGYRGLIGSRIS